MKTQHINKSNDDKTYFVIGKGCEFYQGFTYEYNNPNNFESTLVILFSKDPKYAYQFQSYRSAEIVLNNMNNIKGLKVYRIKQHTKIEAQYTISQEVEGN